MLKLIFIKKLIVLINSIAFTFIGAGVGVLLTQDEANTFLVTMFIVFGIFFALLCFIFELFLDIVENKKKLLKAKKLKAKKKRKA